MEMRESRQASPEQLKDHCLSAELGLCASGVGDGGFYDWKGELWGWKILSASHFLCLQVVDPSRFAVWIS